MGTDNRFDSDLERLQYYLGTGTAESEERFIEAAFVPPRYYNKIINTPRPTPRILVGYKGSGKSTILTVIEKQMLKNNIPVVSINPSDIARFVGESDGSIGHLTHLMETALLQAIASNVGKSLENRIDDEHTNVLKSIAVAEGARKEDLVKVLIQVLSPIAKGVSKIDYGAIVLDEAASHQRKIKNALKMALMDYDEGFYITIDDTSKLYSAHNTDQMNRVWALLLASRTLSQELKFLRVIISMRTEVWMRVTSNLSSERDQLDHFESSVVMHENTELNLRQVLYRRYFMATGHTVNAKDNEHYSPDTIFESKGYTFDNGEYRSWPALLIKNSRLRNRDCIQLLAALVQNALENDREKITDSDFNSVIAEYSKQRIKYVGIETQFRCTDTVTLIERFKSFRSADVQNLGNYTCTAEETKKFIWALPSSIPGLTIAGHTMRPDNYSTFVIWRFLYEIGFLSARYSNQDAERGFDHIDPTKEPNLVSAENWNIMQKMLWEVATVFRARLDELRAFNDSFGGLAYKTKSKRRKKK